MNLEEAKKRLKEGWALTHPDIVGDDEYVMYNEEDKPIILSMTTDEKYRVPVKAFETAADGWNFFRGLLTEEERSDLEDTLHMFKRRVVEIKRQDISLGGCYLTIYVKDYDEAINTSNLPNVYSSSFSKMVGGKAYTPKELGLWIPELSEREALEELFDALVNSHNIETNVCDDFISFSIGDRNSEARLIMSDEACRILKKMKEEIKI